mgnify:CR=1 FL=1
MQATAVGELATIDDKKAPVGDIEDNGLRLGVIRILDELEGHDVVALQPCQVATYVSKQVRGVRAASARLGPLIHSCFCFIPDSGCSLHIVAAPAPGN